MAKVKEVTQSKWQQALDAEVSRAIELKDEHGLHDARWWLTDNEVETYRETIPCIYDKKGRDDELHCPITKEPVRFLPRPATLRSSIKPKVEVLRHAADTTCINLRMSVTVRCYAVVDGRYYITEHKVGKCPWKE